MYPFWQTVKYYKFTKIKENKNKSKGKRLEVAKIFLAMLACFASEQKTSLLVKVRMP